MAGEQKKAFIIDMIRTGQALVAIVDKLKDQDTEYFNAGYNGGGADEILDADLTPHDMTAAEFTNYVTLIEQLIDFANGDPVAQAVYISTLNQLRRAPGV
jgi:hypothetical protein